MGTRAKCSLSPIHSRILSVILRLRRLSGTAVRQNSIGDPVRAERRKTEDETCKGERRGLGQFPWKEDSCPGGSSTQRQDRDMVSADSESGEFQASSVKPRPANPARQFLYSERNTGCIFLVFSNLYALILREDQSEWVRSDTWHSEFFSFGSNSLVAHGIFRHR